MSQSAAPSAGTGTSLARALTVSLAVVFVLAGAAFWPEKRWAPSPRPRLAGSIVLDELVNPPPPPVSLFPATPAEPR